MIILQKMKSLWIILVIIAMNYFWVESCKIPSIENGQVVRTSNKKILGTGEDYDDFEAVGVKCKPGYSILTIRPIDNQVLCLADDKWNQEFKTCQKHCLNSDLVDYTSKAYNCKLNGTPVPCYQNQVSGTRVRVQCQTGYDIQKLPIVPSQYRCLSSGKWNHPTYKCFAICGQQTPIARHYIALGQQAGITEAPWNVAVYKNLEHICGGTILTEKIILSAAHCFYDESDGQVTLNYLEFFKIVAGKYHRDLNKKESHVTQIFDVAKVEAHSDYRGKSNLNIADIAYVILNGFIRYQPHIAPICMKYNIKYSSDREILPGSKGLVAGWGKTEAGEVSETLKAIEVPVVSHSQCKQEASADFYDYVTGDKICMGYRDGSGTCTGDSGAALALPETEGSRTFFFLRGIVSIGKASITGCDLGFYTLNTNVQDYIPFIENATHNYPSVEGSQTETESTLSLPENEVFPSKSCSLKNGQPGICTQAKSCEWAKQKAKKGLFKELVVCEFKGRASIVCCPLAPEKRKSEKYCDIIKNLEQFDKTMHEDENEKLDLNPNSVKTGEFPFMVAVGFIEKEMMNGTTSIRYRCTGSLISKSWVLTSSVCIKKEIESLRFGSVSLTSDSGYPQKIDIKSYRRHPDFSVDKKYNDIGLIELARPVDLLYGFARPICLPSIYSRSPDDNYIITGWSLAVGDHSTDTLRKTNISELPLDECIYSFTLPILGDYRGENTERIVDSHICSLSNSKKSPDVCVGESGGPIFYKAKEDYYIYGITSFGNGPCRIPLTDDYYTVFTRVGSFLDWIEENVWPGVVEL